MWRSQGLGEGFCELFSGGQRCKSSKAPMAGGGMATVMSDLGMGGRGGKSLPPVPALQVTGICLRLVLSPASISHERNEDSQGQPT